MNSKIKNLSIEKILFFDVESVYKTKDLEIDSPEYLAFQHKMREKSTDELMEAHEVLDMYKRKAPSYLTYNKIVCISVGMVSKDGVVRIKALTGEEKDIIEQFCNIANKFDYLTGVNLLGFDVPILTVNGARYFDMTEMLKDSFSTSGKKPWEVKNVICLMETFKGTGFINPSLVEMCLHFGIETPKDDISGADVSRVFYEEDNGIERIAKYCNKDVFATINLFQAMRHKERFDSFVDAGVADNKKEEPKQYQTLLHELYETKMFNQVFKDKLKAQLKAKKIKKAEVETTKKLILASYLEKIEIGDREVKAKEEINKNRTEEVEQFIKEL